MLFPLSWLFSGVRRRSAALVSLLGLVLVGVVLAGCAEAARERLGLGLAPPMSVAVIVHGTDTDPFWDTVREGAVDAAQTFDVNLFWRSTPSTQERVTLINEVVQQGFDVLVVSLPDPAGMERVVRDAIVQGLTVFVVNTGEDYATSWGADSYFGQVESVAGLAVGDRLAEAGATHLLCVKHEENNEALDTRCQRAGSRVGQLTELPLDLTERSVAEQIRSALAADPSIDAVITMTTQVMNQAAIAIATIRGSFGNRLLVHGVFELNESVLDAIDTGQVEFAVDQQPYLQGYLPVAYARLIQYQYRDEARGDELADALLQWIAGRGVILGPGFIDSSNTQAVREAMARAEALE